VSPSTPANAGKAMAPAKPSVCLFGRKHDPLSARERPPHSTNESCMLSRA
jgi:hypothetical protein